LARFVKERRIAFALDIARRKIQEEKESKDPLKDSDDETESTEEVNQDEKKLRATAEAISNSQFTIWTSMLKRSMETAASFDPDEYDIKVRSSLRNKKQFNAQSIGT
jgi:6-phosphofructo-2-kinase